MTAPTRRQLMAGSLAAVGAAGAPGIASATTPRERVQNAVQELRQAVDERWPGRDIMFDDWLDDHDAEGPPMLLMLVRRPR